MSKPIAEQLERIAAQAHARLVSPRIAREQAKAALGAAADLGAVGLDLGMLIVELKTRLDALKNLLAARDARIANLHKQLP
jgi:hypothetical protein